MLDKLDPHLLKFDLVPDQPFRIRPHLLATEYDCRNLFITLIVRCVNKICGMMRMRASFLSLWRHSCFVQRGCLHISEHFSCNPSLRDIQHVSGSLYLLSPALCVFSLCLKKVSHLTFVNNFGKCRPIFKILSPTDS